MKKLYLLLLTSMLCLTALAETTIPNNTIYYTTKDGKVCTPYSSGTSIFGASIVSNTYQNGQGIITFDKDVTSIGGYAFYNCTGLTSITIPNSVTSIGDYAFYYCKGLTSINIPNRVTDIGEWTFYYCSALTSINMPNSVTNIGGYAFYGCSSFLKCCIKCSIL